MFRRICVVVLAAASLSGLAACGGDDDDDTSPVERVAPSGPQDGVRATVGGGWVSVTDPLNGRSFRCLSGWDSSGYSSGGPFLWCYEVTP